MTDFDTCALCPRLCRPACPVATATHREAAVPAVIAARLLEWARGQADPEVARAAATLCTDCGACQSFCHIDRPLPEALRRARASLVTAPAPEPLRPIEGEGRLVAVEADARPFAAALARRLGEPVRRWPTGDRLGVAAVEHEGFTAHGEALRARAEAAEIVVADGGVAHALTAAGARFRWLHEAVPSVAAGAGSCRAGGGARPLACCGASGPLAAHHPDAAARLARTFAARLDGDAVIDARCGEHLRAAGAAVRDALDRLLAEAP